MEVRRCWLCCSIDWCFNFAWNSWSSSTLPFFVPAQAEAELAIKWGGAARNWLPGQMQTFAHRNAWHSPVGGCCGFSWGHAWVVSRCEFSLLSVVTKNCARPSVQKHAEDVGRLLVLACLHTYCLQFGFIQAAGDLSKVWTWQSGTTSIHPAGAHAFQHACSWLWWETDSTNTLTLLCNWEKDAMALIDMAWTQNIYRIIDSTCTVCAAQRDMNVFWMEDTSGSWLQRKGSFSADGKPPGLHCVLAGIPGSVLMVIEHFTTDDVPRHNRRTVKPMAARLRSVGLVLCICYCQAFSFSTSRRTTDCVHTNLTCTSTSV